MYCSHCGTQLPDGSKFCGNCGSPVSVDENAHKTSGFSVPTSSPIQADPKKQKKKNGCLTRIGIVLLIILIALIVLTVVFSTTPAPRKEASVVERAAPSATADEKEIYPILLCDNEYLRAELTGIHDYKDIFGSSTQDLETCYLEISAKNQYSGKVTVVLDDLSVNDTMAQSLSGMPFDVLEGKSGINSFFFSYGQLPIAEKDDIENLEFRIVVMDENWSEIYRSDIVSILEFPWTRP